MKSWVVLLVGLLFLSACGGGSSSSGSGNSDSATPTTSNNTADIDGTYEGNINVTASALGLSTSDSEPITLVIEGGNLTYQGADPGEQFSTPVDSQGQFSGSFTAAEDGCVGTIQISGSVNVPNITGSVDGDGECQVDGDSVDVTFSGNFSATRQ